MVFKKVLIGQPLRADNWPCHTDKLSLKDQFKNSPKLKAYNKDDLVLTLICDNDFVVYSCLNQPSRFRR